MKVLITFLLLIVFAALPQAGQGQSIEPGLIVTRDNLKRYLPQLKKMLIPSYYNHVINGLEQGWITLPVIEMKDYPLPKGYAACSERNRGKLKVSENNALIGWKGGLPFFEPKNGAEVAWNAYRQGIYPDECSFDARWTLCDKKGKPERKVEMTLWNKSWYGRADAPPMPEMPGNNGILDRKESFLIRSPFDARGFAMIRIRYNAIERPDEVFSYIPAIRRIRRLTGGDTTDPLLGSDVIVDDFAAWRQKITPRMTFKILEKRKFLVPTWYVREGQPDWEFVKGTCYQCEWEIRPLWVLEISINDPDYKYSKRILHIDIESRRGAPYSGDNYDQKGRYYRSCFYTIPHVHPKTAFCLWYAAIYKNILTGHCTVFREYRHYLAMPECLVSKEVFTVKGLLQRSR